MSPLKIEWNGFHPNFPPKPLKEMLNTIVSENIGARLCVFDCNVVGCFE